MNKNQIYKTKIFSILKTLIVTAAGLVFVIGIVELAIRQGSSDLGLEQAVSAQTTKITAADAEAARKDYRDVVLKHMTLGETVSVPDDRIGYLEGSVRLVPRKRAEAKTFEAKSFETTKSLPKTTVNVLGAEIERLADRLSDPAAKEGMRSFARGATEEEKYAFLFGGQSLDLNQYLDKPVTFATATPEPKKDCYNSCQTLCHASCKTVCKWDCRIVNGEKVCEESCSTICPEVCNVVCHRVCN